MTSAREQEAIERMPPWATETPDLAKYVGAEIAIAGMLSTMPPFDVYHPVFALPFARAALEALDKWEPEA